MVNQYYVIRIKFLKDGTVKKSEVMDYETQRQAETKFHNNLATDMADETLEGSTCVIMNAYGGVTKSEHWEVEKPAPEPDVEG